MADETESTDAELLREMVVMCAKARQRKAETMPMDEAANAHKAALDALPDPITR